MRTLRFSTTEVRLFAAMALVAAVASTAGYAMWARDLRAEALASLSASLDPRLRLAVLLLGDADPESAGAAELDAVVDRAAAAAGARVTWIDATGRVVGDSEVPLDHLDALSDQRERPEIAQARSGAVGRDLRVSETVGRELLYLALELPRGGWLRIASDLSDFERELTQLRERAVAAALAGVAAAALLALVLGRSTRKPFEELQRVAAQLASGDLDSVLPLRLRPELGAIADAVQQLGRQSRERLAETSAEKQRLQAVLEGMAEGVLVVDVEGRCVLANDRWREFFGVKGELRGKRLLEVLRDVELVDLIDDAARQEEPVARVLRSEHAAARVLRVQAAPFPATGDERQGTVAVFHDITELARLEQVRRDFVANASHELRTPLAAIGGFAETLLASPELAEAERRNYLEIIERNAVRLAKIVADLLDLARLDRPEPELVFGAVDVAACLRRLVAEASARFAAKQLRVDEALSGELAAWADPGAVDQVLRNLVDNAIQYTESGGRISLEAESDANSVRVRVRDTGVGIPAPDRERIFERFYRVDKARSRALGGTGLGLSIVKHLVQRMGGEIRVESEVGVGTCMHLRLPRAPGPSMSPDHHRT